MKKSYVTGFSGTPYAMACRMLRALSPYQDFPEVQQELRYWARVKRRAQKPGKSSKTPQRGAQGQGEANLEDGL